MNDTMATNKIWYEGDDTPRVQLVKYIKTLKGIIDGLREEKAELIRECDRRTMYLKTHGLYDDFEAMAWITTIAEDEG